MRKIKHWAGYGCVMAGRVNDSSCTLHVKVEGTHEQGIARDVWDTYTLYKWLVERFDKSAPDYITWINSHPLIDLHENFRFDPVKGYVDIADYYFTY